MLFLRALGAILTLEALMIAFLFGAAVFFGICRCG